MNRAYTEKVINQLGLDITVDEAVASWWWPAGVKSYGRPRLTATGFEVLSEHIESYEFPLANQYGNMSLREILALTETLPVPYYINTNISKVYIFCEELAVAIKLYGGLKEYIAAQNGQNGN